MSNDIYTKLAAIQHDLEAPKSQYNEFGKYRYRSCEDILQAVKPLLSATKTVLLLDDTMVEVGGRVYVKATARLIDTENGEDMMVDAYAREEETKKGMDASQITGTASSYARKYALNGLFAIDDAKDSDVTNTTPKEVPKSAPKPEPKPAPKPRRDLPPPDIMPEPMENEDGYYICKDCGEVIRGTRLQNGQQLSPKEVAIMAMNQFGVQTCYTCGRARMLEAAKK